METTHNDKIIKYTALLCFILIINLITLFLNNSAVGVVIMWTLTVVCLVYARFNIFHPLSWFTVVFSLYYTAYALLILVYGQTLSYGLTVESLRYSIIALSTVIIICGFPNNEKYYLRNAFKHLNTDDIAERDYYILEKCLIVGMVVAFVLTFIVSRTFVSKSMETKGSLFGICAYLIRALTFLLGAYILGSDDNKIVNNKIIIVCGILCCTFGFLNAERDCILRYMIVLVITLFFKNKIHVKHFIILIPVGIAAMVLINSLKYFFINRSVRRAAGGLIQSFLSSDFGAPGGNLQNLVNNNMSGLAGYKTIFTDIVRGVIPTVKIGINYNTWYNNYFFRGSSYSRAFTLVGEGYLIDGYLGVIILFTIIALIIVFLSKRIQRSVWSTMAYVYGIVTIVSCFRGTLIDIVTGLVRTPLIAIFIFLLFQGLYNKGKVRVKL